MNYTLKYHCVARNLSPSVQSQLMVSAAPIDTDTITLAGLALVSDTPSLAGAVATRTIILTDAAQGIMPPGQPTIDLLTDLMTSQIAQALKAPVTAEPVT